MASYLRQKWQSFQITSSCAQEQEAEEEQDCRSSEQDEPTKIGIMRTLVEAQDPTAKVRFFSHFYSPILYLFDIFFYYCYAYLESI